MLALLAVASMVWITMRRRASSESRPGPGGKKRWFALAFAGALFPVAATVGLLAIDGSYGYLETVLTPNWLLPRFIRGAATWLVTGFLLVRFAGGRPLLFLVPIVHLLSTFVWQAVYYLQALVFPQGRAVELLPALESFTSDFDTPRAMVIAASHTLLLAWLSLSPKRNISLADIGGGFYGGFPMSDEQSDSTRYLAAAAYQGTLGVGDRVLDFIKRRGRAVAPELGVDLKLVAEVAKYAHHRALFSQLIYSGLALVALALAAMEVPALIALPVLAAGICWFVRSHGERKDLRVFFSHEGFTPEVIRKKFGRGLDGQESDAIPAPDANLTVYSGFSPFLGCGFDFGGWSFAIATDKGKDGAAPQPFEIGQIYAAVGQAIQRLQLAGVEQRDHFFIHGQDLNGDQELLPDKYERPCQHISAESAGKYALTSDPRVRHYRWIRVRDWGGDLVFSYFLRCSVRGPTLFVEVKRYLLTPMLGALRAVDNLGEESVGEVMSKLFVASPIAGFFAMVFAPFGLVARLMAGLSEVFGAEERARRRLIDSNPRYNHGASSTTRQDMASGDYAHYFQRADSDYYQKIIEKEVLDTLVEFLDVRNIDTSDLKDRQSTILNHGVIVQGGNIEAGSLAVGQGAKSMQNTVKRFVGRARGAAAGGEA